MHVSDIMTRNPVTIQPGDSLRAALELMEEMDFHHLPVISPARHLIGIITARECRAALRLPDLVREEWKDLELVDRLTVRDVMSSTLVAAEPDMPAEEAARLMLMNYVSGLPVMRGETLVGIVTTSDLLIAFVATLERRALRTA
ncbi:MAG: CBS domain-containing protein [Anaerolineae bacterium]|nr:CBS domain-containing protein [Anaerolineae bacterium]